MDEIDCTCGHCGHEFTAKPEPKHVLLCGDSTNADHVKRMMGPRKAVMMFTDPPWNVAIGGDGNPRHRQREGLANDNLDPEQFSKFLTDFIRAVQPHIAGDVYCVLGASEWPTLDLALRSNGYHWSATIIWVKDIFVLGRSKFHRRYEPIWYGWHGKGKSSFGDKRDQDDVWEVPRPRVSDEHPTMKPVDLVKRAIENSSRPGDLVVDPFGGSGTTMIACVIVERYVQFVGNAVGVVVIDADGQATSYNDRRHAG